MKMYFQLYFLMELDHAAQQHVARAAGLLHELAGAGEDRLDVRRGRPLAANLRHEVHGVVKRQHVLVVGPERVRRRPCGRTTA